MESLGIHGIESSSESDTSDCEEQKDDNLIDLDDSIVNELVKLKERMQPIRQSSNQNKTKLIFFTVPAIFTCCHINNQSLRKSIEGVILSLYVFKLQYTHNDQWTHGMYINFQGYCHRSHVRSFVEVFLKFFIQCPVPTMIQVRPKRGHKMSVVEYVKSLYGSHHNLLVQFQQHGDAVVKHAKTQIGNYTEVQRIVAGVKDEAKEILEVMMSAPAFYKQSTIWNVLSMKQEEFHEYMQSNSINDLQYEIVKDAYNAALQRTEQSKSIINGETLLHHTIQRSIVNKLTTETLFKRLQLLLSQYFGATFIHPHPLSRINQSNIGDFGVFDGMLLSPRFMFSVILTSRWFARVCLQQTQNLQNHRANLVFYGQAGAGKTLLASVLSQYIPTYRFLQGGKFQNPDILSSALMYFEEMDISQLVTNQYKALLDIKSAVKMDFKNAHPQNVTENMAAIISTNDSIFTQLRAQIPGRQWRSVTRNQSHTSSNEHSINAAIRRLYLVPLHFGEFSKLHGYNQHEYPAPVGENQKLARSICDKFKGTFEKEQNLLPRLFNLIFAMAVHFQDEFQTLFIPSHLKPYVVRLEGQFKQTLWYQFYREYHSKVDETMERIEQAMDEREISDTEYLKRCYEGAARIESKAVKFMKSLCKDATSQETQGYATVFKDQKCPWPEKTYFVAADQAVRDVFNIRLKVPGVDLMNHGIRQILDNESTSLFKPLNERSLQNIFGEIIPEETDQESQVSLSVQLVDTSNSKDRLLDTCMGRRRNRPEESDEDEFNLLNAIAQKTKRQRVFE